MTLFERIRQGLRRRRILHAVARLKATTVGEVMTRYVITIRPEDDVVKAATKMIAEDISCLVVAEGDKAIGVISERDFLKKVPLSKQVFEMRVRDIMTTNLITTTADLRLPEAAALMKESGIRRLVVVEGDKLMGIITQTDFTRTLNRLLTSYPSMPELQVERIMTRKVITMPDSSTVVEARQRMAKFDIGAIIITRKDVVEGIFTEYDLVMQFYDQRGKLEMSSIDKYVRRYVRAIAPSSGMLEANRLMLEKNMRRLLVVEGGMMKGIVTQTDLCRYLYLNLDLIAKAAADPKTVCKRFSMSSEIHGEFRGEHLKVYTVE